MTIKKSFLPGLMPRFRILNCASGKNKVFFFSFWPVGDAFGNRPNVSFISILSASKQSDIQVYIVLGYKGLTVGAFLLAGIQDVGVEEHTDYLKKMHRGGQEYQANSVAVDKEDGCDSFRLVLTLTYFHCA